ncbi:MAG: hypothetical protein WCY93_10775 [Anaerolineaceae bacterium]
MSTFRYTYGDEFNAPELSHIARELEDALGEDFDWYQHPYIGYAESYDELKEGFGSPNFNCVRGKTYWFGWGRQY